MELGADGSHRLFFDGLPGYGSGAIAVANTGRVFVSAYDSSGSSRIAAISPSGVLEGTHLWPRGAGSEIAVGNDGCTVLFAKGGGIGRINACTGAPLTDFIATSEIVYDIQSLKDGSVLLALGDSVELYDASGAFVRRVAKVSEYGLRGYYPQEVAVSSDGQVLWIAAMEGCFISGGELLRVSMIDGTELSRRYVWPFNNVTGLVVGAPGLASIPTLRSFVLSLLALALAVAGTLSITLR
jgi:DNA-binding beta-propeller fold protein YncE